MAKLARLEPYGNFNPKWHLFDYEESGAIRFQCRKGNGEDWGYRTSRMIPLLRSSSELEWMDGVPTCKHCVELYNQVQKSLSKALDILVNG